MIQFDKSSWEGNNISNPPLQYRRRTRITLTTWHLRTSNVVINFVRRLAKKANFVKYNATFWGIYYLNEGGSHQNIFQIQDLEKLMVEVS